jgi:hypothetical protein
MMGWKPAFGFFGFGQWIGYNEAMILYLLASARLVRGPGVVVEARGPRLSLQHAVRLLLRHLPATVHAPVLALLGGLPRHRRRLHAQRGLRLLRELPSRHVAQRNYCIANPLGAIGYSDSLWGLTAGDGPFGYEARGAPPAQNDDGTITPTAAISSIVFTPNESIGFIRYMWDHYRPTVWGPYGWKDGFNPSVGNWVATDVIGIDQGPILMMIENHLNERPWQADDVAPAIQLGLQRADFQPFVLGVTPPPVPGGVALGRVSPDPLTSRSRVTFQLAREGERAPGPRGSSGRLRGRLAEGRFAAGEHAVPVPRTGSRRVCTGCGCRPWARRGSRGSWCCHEGLV